MFSQWNEWMGFNWTEYRTGLIICGEVDIDLPVFYKIQDVVVRNVFVVLVVLQLKTVCFHNNLYAYRIDPKCTDSLKVFNATELMYYKPCDLQISYGSDNLFWFHNTVNKTWRVNLRLESTPMVLYNP